jgi:hypothetical protein
LYSSFFHKHIFKLQHFIFFYHDPIRH